LQKKWKMLDQTLTTRPQNYSW